MKKKRQVVISILGMAYIEPIINLYSLLNSQDFKKFSKTKVSLKENGYSISIIVLSVLMVESIINRIKYLEKNKTKNNLYFFQNFCSDKNLIADLTEIYIIRDLIAHNHIWRTSYDFDENYVILKTKDLLKIPYETCPDSFDDVSDTLYIEGQKYYYNQNDWSWITRNCPFFFEG